MDACWPYFLAAKIQNLTHQIKLLIKIQAIQIHSIFGSWCLPDGTGDERVIYSPFLMARNTGRISRVTGNLVSPHKVWIKWPLSCVFSKTIWDARFCSPEVSILFFFLWKAQNRFQRAQHFGTMSRQQLIYGRDFALRLSVLFGGWGLLGSTRPQGRREARGSSTPTFQRLEGLV